MYPSFYMKFYNHRLKLTMPSWHWQKSPEQQLISTLPVCPAHEPSHLSTESSVVDSWLSGTFLISIFLTGKIVFLFYFLAIYKDAVADLCRGNVRGFQILEPSGCSRGLKRVPGVPSISLPYISVIFPFSSWVPEGSKSKWFQEPFGPEGSRHPLCSSEGTIRPWNPL